MAAAAATVTDSKRPAWINVADGQPQSSSPEDVRGTRRTAGAQVLRRETRTTDVASSRGKENSGRVRGVQPRGISLRRSMRPQEVCGCVECDSGLFQHPEIYYFL